MRRVFRLIETGSLYTVLITSVFMLFSALSGLSNPAITAGRFFIILGFGMLLSVAGLLFEAKNLPYFVKIILHYVTALVAFVLLFVVIGNLAARGVATVFAVSVFFTALYFLLFFLIRLLRRFLDRHPEKSDKKTGTEGKAEEEYSPHFHA
ncbi:MAG TPA: hypothetical protein DDY70_03910 [Clostridiales bacterium]|nr:hypothetical protein [Clostridiales bacterium]